MKNKNTYLLLVSVVLFIAGCNKDNNNPIFIKNQKAKYLEEEFVTLSKSHTIDLDSNNETFIKQIMGMDVDSEQNLYLLDYYFSKLNVFDIDGEYLRSIGGKGEGPKELIKPLSFSIFHDTLYIYQMFNGIKVMDSFGDYIDFISVKEYVDNAVFKKISDGYLGYHSIMLNEPYEKEIHDYYTTLYDNDLNIVKNINIFKLDVFKDPQYHPYSILAIDKENHVYLPSDNGRQEYEIQKKDFEGNVLFTFGRVYENKPYSDTVKEFYKNKLKGNEYIVPQLDDYPGIVRYITVDDNNLIWVVVGECNKDIDRIGNLVSTIDIFNTDGEFLYSFESDLFGMGFIIKNGKLYSPSPYDGNQYVKVFNIEYNFDN